MCRRDIQDLRFNLHVVTTGENRPVSALLAGNKLKERWASAPSKRKPVFLRVSARAQFCSVPK